VLAPGTTAYVVVCGTYGWGGANADHSLIPPPPIDPSASSLSGSALGSVGTLHAINVVTQGTGSWPIAYWPVTFSSTPAFLDDLHAVLGTLDPAPEWHQSGSLSPVEITGSVPDCSGVGGPIATSIKPHPRAVPSVNVSDVVFDVVAAQPSVTCFPTGTVTITDIQSITDPVLQQNCQLGLIFGAVHVSFTGDVGSIGEPLFGYSVPHNVIPCIASIDYSGDSHFAPTTATPADW